MNSIIFYDILNFFYLPLEGFWKALQIYYCCHVLHKDNNCAEHNTVGFRLCASRVTICYICWKDLGIVFPKLSVQGFLEMNTNISKFLVSLGLTIIPEALNTLKKHCLLQQYSYTFWRKQGAVVVSLVSHKVSGSSSTLSSGILLYTSSSFVNLSLVESSALADGLSLLFLLSLCV